MTARPLEVGKTYRNKGGGSPWVVVGYDGALALVKDARSSKRQLATPAGGRLVAPSEFHEWVAVAEPATLDLDNGSTRMAREVRAAFGADNG